MARSNHSPIATDDSIMRRGYRNVIVISSHTSDAGSCLDGEMNSSCQKEDSKTRGDMERAVAKMENKNKKEEDDNKTKENKDEDENGEENDNKTKENEDEDDDVNGEEDDNVKKHEDKNGEEETNDKGKDETKEDLADSFYTCEDHSLATMVWSTDEYLSDGNDTTWSRK